MKQLDLRDLTKPAVAVTSLDSLETESQPVLSFDRLEYESPYAKSVLFRHTGWKRNRLLIAESLHRTTQSHSRQKSFMYCGSYAIVLRSVDNPSKYRVAGSCCHDRFCLPCSTERSYTIARNVLEAAEGKQVRFLTLTIKTDGLSLGACLDKIYRGFNMLRRRAFWGERVTGGVAFLENKWSEEHQRWHPHFHCLIEGLWLDRKLVQQAWREITGDSYIVDIRMPKGEGNVVKYITKYASKPFNSSFVNRPLRLDEAVRAMHGRKLAITFGSWRGVLLWNPPDSDSWEFVASLNRVIDEASNGDIACNAILESLTDRDLTEVLTRAPPVHHHRKPSPPSCGQLTFWAIWDSNNCLLPTRF